MGLIFVFNAPGHLIRANLYTRFNMPDFLSLNLFQKLMRGFTSTSAYLLCGKNLIWPLFWLMLFLVTIARRKNWLIRFIASIPVLCSVFFGVLQDYLLPQKLKELFC